MKSILTPLDFLARSAFVYRDRIAAVEGERKFTYAEFNQRIHRLASALTRVGVEPGNPQFLPPKGARVLQVDAEETLPEVIKTQEIAKAVIK